MPSRSAASNAYRFPTTPPESLEALEARAQALAGVRVADLLQSSQSAPEAEPSVRRKGKLGQLVERALGATSGSAQAPDFPELGVELKTIPLDAQGRPRESTFVSSFSLHDAEEASWETSGVYEKLRHVLFVPVLTELAEPRFGEPVFFQPTAAQDAIMRADFDDIIGLVAIGRIEDLSAHMGRWLQARPKAAHSRVRTRAWDSEGPAYALPRGFYLRARVTAAILADPRTTTTTAPNPRTA